MRALIRERVPELLLGGWANPHRPASEQVAFLASDSFEAEFFLTQVVSHHSVDRVEALLDAKARRGVNVPGVFGVFFYRSANPVTLEKLGDFFPVPAEALTRRVRRRCDRRRRSVPGPSVRCGTRGRTRSS